MIYVDDDALPEGDGLTWESAYSDLQDALDYAFFNPKVEEIWVAEGTYTPDRGTGIRELTFQLLDNVGLYGGFAAWETERHERDADNNPTILSGDLGIPDDASDNSFHVVSGSFVDATAILDGFIITAGNADSDLAPDDDGGGMLVTNGSPTVIDCTFTGNSASRDGGAMFIDSGDPRVIDCTFTGNSASGGGAMYMRSSGTMVTRCVFDANSASTAGAMRIVSSDPTVIDCTFTGNSASSRGGAIDMIDSDTMVTGCVFDANSANRGGVVFMTFFAHATLTDCTITGNSASSNGGAVFVGELAAVTLKKCAFADNQAPAGGAIYANFPRDSAVSECSFIGNSAIDPVGDGGAIWSSGLGVWEMTDCTFGGNSARNNGGALYVSDDSDPVVINCLFTSNWAGNTGGAMYSRNEADPTVINSTFARNTAEAFGGALYAFFSSPSLSNCILWDDSPDEIFDVTRQVELNYCNIEGGWPLGEGNIDADPLFADPDNDDYHLSAGSPCIDAADGDALPPEIATDLDGNPRYMDDWATPDTGHGTCWVPDMGAYEFPGLIADFDRGGQVDLFDFEFFQDCFTGPLGGPVGPECECADLDHDTDVDLIDWRIFQAAFTGE